MNYDTDLKTTILNCLQSGRPSHYVRNNGMSPKIRCFLNSETSRAGVRPLRAMGGWLIDDAARYIHTDSTGMTCGHAELIDGALQLKDEKFCPASSTVYGDTLKKKTAALTLPVPVYGNVRARAALLSRLKNPPTVPTPSPEVDFENFEYEIAGKVSALVHSTTSSTNIFTCLALAVDLFDDARINQSLLLAAGEQEDGRRLTKLADCVMKKFTARNVDDVMDFADRFGVILDDYYPAFLEMAALASAKKESSNIRMTVERIKQLRRYLEAEYPGKKGFIRARLAELASIQLGTRRNSHKPFDRTQELYYLSEIWKELDNPKPSSVVTAGLSPMVEIPTMPGAISGTQESGRETSVLTSHKSSSASKEEGSTAASRAAAELKSRLGQRPAGRGSDR